MSKAILVLDYMPNYCNDCKFVADSIGYCELEHEAIKGYSFWSDFNKKPNWCPLKELPEKQVRDYPEYDRYITGYDDGLDACINEILGE